MRLVYDVVQGGEVCGLRVEPGDRVVWQVLDTGSHVAVLRYGIADHGQLMHADATGLLRLVSGPAPAPVPPPPPGRRRNPRGSRLGLVR